MGPGAERGGNQGPPASAAASRCDAGGAAGPRLSKVRRRPSSSQRQAQQQPQSENGVNATVLVEFRKTLAPADEAFLLAEVVRHVMFMRGQLPMPYRQLRKVLEEREAWDRLAEEKKVARISSEDTYCRSSGGGVGAKRNLGRAAKSVRPLAKASAHRRGRKAVAALEETSICIEEAFVDAGRKGRPVLEALILLGASHLSPREIYSVTFPEHLSDPLRHLNGDEEAIASKSAADAYSRKLVRSLVGGMSGVSFRGIGSCRVHVFLRVADASFPNEHAVTVTSEPPADAAVANFGDSVETSLTKDSTTTYVKPSFTGAEAAILRHLTPRPGFKVRRSRSRPSPRVHVRLSKHSATTNDEGKTKGQVFGSESDALQHQHRHQERQSPPAVEGNGNSRRAESSAAGKSAESNFGMDPGNHDEQSGSWYQLVCARLAGVKGCDSLAN